MEFYSKLVEYFQKLVEYFQKLVEYFQKLVEIYFINKVWLGSLVAAGNDDAGL